MKYGNEYFMQVSRRIVNDEKYKGLSLSARWLYLVLKELEHRFCSAEKHFFLRSDEQLAEDSGMCIATIKRAKKELKNTDLVKIGTGWYVNNEGQKVKHVTSYTLLV